MVWSPLFRRLGYRRAILQSDGESSMVALKTTTLLAVPFVDLVLCESAVDDHVINDVAESAIHEMKRQTQTLNFAMEAHVGKIVESHSILRWIPMMRSATIRFFWIDRDDLIAEMQRSGRPWKKLVEEFGESVY